jgi:predicted nucleic acid-binding protein
LAVISPALADTGPMVAIFRTREKAHKKCAATLKALRPPLLTCWPVLTEAAWLLRNEPGGFKALAGLLDRGVVQLAALDQTAIPRIVAFLDRYASANAQLADAALMYLAEHEGIDTVFTLDRRDFSI